MSRAVQWTDGTWGHALSLEGEERILLTANRAFAPGTPMELTMKLDSGPLLLQAKSLGSKRRHDGLFDVRARLVTLRRADRDLLRAALTVALPE